MIFEGSCFSAENYVLTLRETTEHTALRVLPLEERCRDLNRKYILPVGYGQNNLFLCNWSEDDFGELEFYDIFDKLYPMLYKRDVPYSAGGIEGEVHEIPETIFEKVITEHFRVDRATLRSKTKCSPAHAAYEYKPRGFDEAEYPDIPYPEVVSYTENQDGTITLIINAVYANENTSRAYSHKTVIRPLGEGAFQYVSNQVISAETDYHFWWHSERLF